MSYKKTKKQPPHQKKKKTTNIKYCEGEKQMKVVFKDKNCWVGIIYCSFQKLILKKKQTYKKNSLTSI